MGRVTNYILIALIFLAVAIIGVLFANLQQLIDYKSCMNQPLNQVSDHCKEVINGNL